MKINMRGIAIAIILGCALSACRQDPLFEEGKESKALEIDESNLVDAGLKVTLNALGVSSSIGTRDAEPSEEEEPVSDDEKKVIDMWVFQYDATSEQLVIYPRYYTVENQEDLEDFPVELGEEVASRIYVVTNTHDQTWADSDNYTKFATISDLQEQTLSDPNSVMLGDSNDVVDAAIPMEGMSEEVTIRSGSTVTVLVTRMYAKVKIRIVLAEVLSRYYENVEVNYVEVDGIPYYCRIGSLESDETVTEGAVSFPSGTEFHTRAFNEVDDADEDSYPYIIYVPENLRGENDNSKDTPEDKGSLSPANALSVTVRVIFSNYGSGELASSTSTYHYTVYPGGNSYNNFNIRRNNVYRVTVNVGYPSEEIPEPSANCICGFAGETLSFYPYYREETGDGYYNFSNYLDPTDEEKTIRGLKIIWQMAKYPEHNTASSAANYKRCIGDNSAGDKVQLVYNANQDEEIYRWKIYVATQAAGNALIAAYNDEACEGDILWSWHIWVRDREDGDPSNIANALTYYTYHWDESGIDIDKGHTRELGYPVMDCNLGALANDVTGTSTNEFMLTCGLDYQWGRKDPFPAPGSSTMAYNSGNASGSSTQNNIQTYDNSDNWINLDGSTGCVDATNSAGETPLFNAAYSNTIGSANADAIAYTVKNPTTFISTYTYQATTYTQFNISTNYLADEDGSIGDWLPDQDDCLWGGTDDYTKSYKAYSYSSSSSSSFEATLKDNFGPNKTIFDPCPYGWRVSPGDIWIGFTNTGKNTSTTSTAYTDETDYFNCSDSNMDINNYKGYHFYMQGWMTGQTSWFPIQGTRQASGQAQGFRGCGNYHNATAERDLANVAGNVTIDDVTTTYRSQIRRVDILHIHSSDGNFIHTFENQLRYTIRSIGGPVRCVRDTK